MASSRPASSRLFKPSASLGADNAGKIQLKSHAKVVASAKAAAAGATARGVVTSPVKHVKYDKPASLVIPINISSPSPYNKYHATVIDDNDNNNNNNNNNSDNDNNNNNQHFSDQ